ncbi:MAG: fluoride efflux transporter CrcB [Chloroflexota bacterium]|nr:fluoride efflux transporter CrcB [Chloroflexota bacterium]
MLKSSPLLVRQILAIFCGGFLGTITRYGLSFAIQAWFGNSWPYDILLINLTGAFILALFTTLTDASVLFGPTRRLFLNVGFLGAYTTFSSLALGDVLLFGKGQIVLALLYLMASLIGGLLAVMLGMRCGNWYVTLAKRAPLHAKEHVDVDDDLLLFDADDEREVRSR